MLAWPAVPRAQPDWAYEFPDQIGQDTQICLTGTAGLDWIRTYNLKILPTNMDKDGLLYQIKKQKKNIENNLDLFFLFFKCVNSPVSGK